MDERKKEWNKAGYTATLVACGWAGAANLRKAKCDGQTDQWTERVVESRAGD